MGLYLVGETIDKTRGHSQAEAGKLVQLRRGIYADAGDDVDATVLKHAIRIAKYLYPRAYLSAAGAALLGPTREGRLFLSGRRIQRTRIRALEIIQNQAPPHPSLGEAVVDDGMGEFRVDVSSIRQRFLEAFRLRSEHAASLDEAMREAIAARLIEEYGSPSSAADAVWTLARQNEWYREGERAERFLLRRPAAAPARNEAALDLIVAWHGVPIGHLVHDGFEWRWTEAERSGPPVVRQTTPGKLPPFIGSLLPEGWLEAVLRDRDDRATLRSGKRYLSSITIVERQSELAALPPDVLLTPLDRYAANGIFTGTYAGPGRGDIEEGFEKNLAKLYERADTPRLSGIQIKAPMSLDADGTLSPAIGRPFTHILKPAGPSGFEALPVIEWMALALGRAVGFAPPPAALVAMPDHMPPALLVERFDLRESPEDRRLIALEDFCSVLGLPTPAKYDGTIERVAKAVRQLSTAPDEDVLIVIKRALFAWLIADGDMHLKNIALLKIGDPGDAHFRSVRIAPLYDTVTTRIFPRLAQDRMALKLNGRDDWLRRADFRALATTAGATAADGDAAITEMIQRMGEAAGAIALPELPEPGPDAAAMAAKMIEITRARIESFE
ncbi:MAG: type II toxin-antitoxin system HipA family toxin [Candidatus Rokubacteria bacterium]|nr:type II toxin-antitoxin system HipA family toxin [Candidatus Rokubacteria bacterium]MBI2198383.1 type II toxin-antitoxin system HipA family toxin [Candidatus Rokubacteria bacterium]MBI3104903.1 type II toxin-antitoxin system HipA family toxin [Candidatus Rokubacteria bacterium]